MSLGQEKASSLGTELHSNKLSELETRLEVTLAVLFLLLRSFIYFQRKKTEEKGERKGLEQLYDE